MKKIFSKKTTTEKTTNGRITNDSLENYRREAIERGRRFKYPIQYEKHKVVINASIIGVIVIILFGGGLWWSLYKAQAHNSLIFKITQFVPLPVGKIDRTNILYSDYLAQYRVSLHYYQTKEISASGGQSMPAEIKQKFRSQALENATLIALARQVASEEGVSVTEQEKNDDLRQKLSLNGEQMSLAEFDRIINEYYGLSTGEYRNTFIHNPLLIRKVQLQIDQAAKKTVEKIEQDLKSETDLALVADRYQSEVELFNSGLVKTNNSDGGRSAEAVKLAVGQVSPAFVLSDSTGYCFVKLLDRDSKNNISYQSLTIPFKELTRRLESLRKQQKINYFIKID